MGREIAHVMGHQAAGWLERPDRETEERTDLLVEAMQLKPKEVVADIGAGSGYFCWRMAKLVGPEGRILAVDIQQEMLDDLEKRAGISGVENVQTVRGEVHDPKLEPDSCDLILLVDVYHEFSHPVPMLAAMRTALKPDGVVALVEFRGEDPEVPIKTEHKMSKDQIKKEWEANGFSLDREFDGLPWQHLMFWKRK